MYGLVIETATVACSVALFKETALLVCVECTIPKSHSSHLTLFIEEVFQKSGLSPKDLAAVAVSIGPGSYTGLRIGLSVAKGMAYALDIPLITLSTPEIAMMGGISYLQEGDFLIPMIDAMRMEVYAQVFEKQTQKMEAKTAIEDWVVTPETLLPYLETQQKVYLCGEGSLKIKSLYPQNQVQVLDYKAHSAAWAGELWYAAFEKQQFVDLALSEPYYFKEVVFRESKKKGIQE